jgi:hypothetical protein
MHWSMTSPRSWQRRRPVNHIQVDFWRRTDERAWISPRSGQQSAEQP